MKTSFFRPFIGAPIIFLLLCLATFCSCEADETDNVLPNYDVNGAATGAQMTPSVIGTGSAYITGSFNPNTRILTFTTSWSGLSGPPTGGGFYKAMAGMTAASVGTPWVFNGAPTNSGSSEGSLTLTEAQADELVNGLWFFKYMTAINPNGEVRGQVNTSR